MTALQDHLAEHPEARADAEKALHLVGELISHISAIKGHVGSGNLHTEMQAAIDHATREAGHLRDEIGRLLRPHQPVETNQPVPER